MKRPRFNLGAVASSDRRVRNSHRKNLKENHEANATYLNSIPDKVLSDLEYFERGVINSINNFKHGSTI
jgi:hypothetical protein